MSFDVQIVDDPRRLQVFENSEWVATFTPGCYTVTMAGPERTFAETYSNNGSAVTVQVQHSTWVRAAPGPVADDVDQRWLALALDANQRGVADALAIAMQYLRQSTPLHVGDLQIAGEASYGPLLPDGTRQEGSDFNDYLGLRWLYPADPPDVPETPQFRCLDCSGFMRMVGVTGTTCRNPDTLLRCRCRFDPRTALRYPAVPSKCIRTQWV
jgi:hypothetical protein